MNTSKSAARRAVLGFALLAGSAFAQTTPAQPSAPAAPQDPAVVVARVGSENITLGEFNDRFKVFVGRAVNNQGMPFDESVLAFFGQYRPEILQQVVRQAGLRQLARTAGMTVDDARVEEVLAGNREGFADDAEFQAALQGAGYNNEAQLRQFIREGLLINAYLENLKSRFTFPDTVLRGYYQSNQNEFQRDAQACVKHILVKDEAAAQAAKARLQGGEDFAQVAQDVSLDPGSKAEGGELGCFGRGVTVPEFDRASFEGPLNELQQVKTQFGVHLLVAESRTTGGVMPFEDAKGEINAKLADRAVQRFVDNALGRLGVQSFPERVAQPAPKTE